MEKERTLSWIEIENKVNTFTGIDGLRLSKDVIYLALHQLAGRMEEELASHTCRRWSRFWYPYCFGQVLLSYGASSAKRGRKEEREVTHDQIQQKGTSFSDLPSNLVENVLYRVSIKGIVTCKCVCKTWHMIISDPGFAKQHFNRGQICPLIRNSGHGLLSRMLYLVQEEVMLGRVKHKLDTKLRIPLRNFENVQNNRDGFLKLRMRDHNYKVVNSCNGLLCLTKPYDNDPVIVCNPVTGEFISLPEARTVKPPERDSLELRRITSGFGFSCLTNQYKVVRMFYNWRIRKVVAEVHVLGTNSWKGIDPFHQTKYSLFPTNLNGFLYWLSDHCVVSFEIDKECFRCVPLPPLKTSDPKGNVGMGVLGRELCITEVDIDSVNIWAMKDNNCSAGRWSGLFSFHQCSSFRIPRGSLQPIKYLNDGALLMFNSHSNSFICKDPEKVGCKYIRVRGINSQTEAIEHRPSFVSLNDILVGHDVEILNVNSRCGLLKLYKESKVVSLVEEDQS